jgi:Zn-dependent protease
MLRSFRLGKAFGIPLYLHSTFLLLPLWAAWVARREGLPGILFAVTLVCAAFGCVLLHELGHALMARFFKIGTRDITLYPIGGVARLESTGERPGEELCIALAGPAVNLVLVILLAPLVVLCGLAGLLAGDPTRLVPAGAGAAIILARFVVGLWLANGTLLVFNLIPVFPMDGGRVLRALLSMALPRLRATEIAVWVGLVGAVLLAVLGWQQDAPLTLFVALFVALAGQAELWALRRATSRRRPAERPTVEVVLPSEAVPYRPAEVPLAVPPLTVVVFEWDPVEGTWRRCGPVSGGR